MSNTNLIEQKILAGLIQSTDFLKEVRQDIKTKYFSTRVGRDVANFCLNHFDKYNEAPRENIDVYLDNIRNQGDSDRTVDVVSIMNRLANKIEINLNYLVGETYEFFKTKSAMELAEKISNAAVSGEYDELSRLVNSASVVERPQSIGISPFKREAYEKAFGEDKVTLFGYEGAIGTILNSEFYRGAFFSYIAKTKGGKSFYLMDNAIVALKQGLKVVYIQAGDMSEAAFLKRFYTALTKRNYKPQYCKEHYSPIPDCVHNQRGDCSLKKYCSAVQLFTDDEKKTKAEIVQAIEKTKGYEACTYCQHNPNNCMRYKFAPSYVKVKEKRPLQLKDIEKVKKDYEHLQDNLRIATYHNNSLSCCMIESLLDGWAKQDDFFPDVVIVDYLDIMVDKGMLKDQRQTIKNNVAMGLRRISTKYDICLITATQSDSNGFHGNKLGMSNFRDESKILTHFTAMVGINQNEEAKDLGIVYMNKIMSRDEETNEHSIKVCQDLWIGKPILRTSE
ncbi:MAG: hypothetical protein EOL95_09300 [Bacteroidia bacterium]|nr:hypothetical protein [Bacteroidia bacterium]